ncbi:Ribonuclease 3 [Hypsizygus marmoreus]|uniref:Ribonuclease 3 n=1 Tax=Hypsizygus marmoreus TaxID=39966 RepID=A0A369K881_HYPMA|nr:Ribonuclease 3 [Hypsizygus marmoreus]
MNQTFSAGAGSSTFLKRTHAGEQLDHLPPLPKINSDLVLQVFTHVSLRRLAGRPEDYGDNERLIALGKAVLDVAVTFALFNKRPMLKTSDICTQRDQVLSDANIENWVKTYGLRQKLRCHPNVFPVLNTPKEARSIFYAYVGGVYSEHGSDTVQEWISRLLDDRQIMPPHPPQPRSSQFMDGPPQKKVKSEQPPSPEPSRIFFASQPPPSPPRQPPAPHPPPTSLPNPLAPAQPNLPFLPLFNQTATQRRVTVEYPAEFTGPPHAGRWRVRCVVNGIPKGVGTGSSKQVAKEEAARQAYYAMGWT